MEVFIITGVGAALIAFLGWRSAMVGRAESKTKMEQVQSTEKSSKKTDDKNQDNPAAMAMAGSTSANPAK